MAYSVLRSVPTIGGSSVLIVTVTPACDQLADRMMIKVGDDP